MHRIGLCTMSFNPRLTLNAIKEAESQNYDSKLTQYIIYQKDKSGRYPRHYKSSILRNKLVQSNVPGVWPGVWFIKLMTFLDNCKEPYMAMWDEDDYFEPEYLNKAMRSMINNPNIVVSWNHTNYQISNGEIKIAKYPSPWGTIVAKTEVVRELALQFEKICPRGLVHSRLHGGWHGPLDMPFRKFIVERLGNQKIAEHTGIRWYTWGDECATVFANHRVPQQSFEYGYDGDIPAEIASITMNDGTVINFKDTSNEKKEI